MPMNPVMHALGLHLYQPLDNLHKLLSENAGELRRILMCYERIGRYAHKYAGVARVHVAFSTVLLEQLQDPALIGACRDLADIPSILESLRSAPNIEFVGTGFRHAPLPFIPPEDWEEQLQLERELMAATFGRVLKGYWPPSSLFCAEVIPALVNAGYEYLLLPSHMLAMPDGSDADPYRPYKLTHKGSAITVIPVDGGFSQSQQYGLEAPWFADEVRNGVSLALPYSAPYLLTTCSDGENGEWFRADDEQGFFGSFFSPYMEFCETGAFPVRPVSIPEYLRSYPPQADVVLKAEYQSKPVFPGDQAVKRRLSKAVAQYWSMANTAPGPQVPSADALMEARTLLLRAEESGLLLGDAPGHTRLLEVLKQAEKLLTPKAPAADTKKAPAAATKAAVVEAKKPAAEAIAPATITKTSAPAHQMPVAETGESASPGRMEATKPPARAQAPEAAQMPGAQAPAPLPENAGTDEKTPPASPPPSAKATVQPVPAARPAPRVAKPAASRPAGKPPLKKGRHPKK